MINSINKSGFTLLEIMVASALALILIGGGIAAYSSYGAERDKSGGGSELVAFLRTAQSLSRSGNKPEECATLDGYRVWSGNTAQSESFNAASAGVQNYFRSLRCNGESIDLEVTQASLPGQAFFLNEFDLLFPPRIGSILGAPFTIRIGSIDDEEAKEKQIEVGLNGIINDLGLVEP